MRKPGGLSSFPRQLSDNFAPFEAMSSSSTTSGNGPRKSIRGVMVAPQLVAPPKRGSSVLQNIRGRALPFPSVGTTNTEPPSEDNQAQHQEEEKLSPSRSDSSSSRCRRTKSFSQMIRGPSLEKMLDSLAMLRQDSNRSNKDQPTSKDVSRSDSRSIPRRSTYVLQIQPRRSKSKSPSPRNTSMENFHEMPIDFPNLPGATEGSPEKTTSRDAGPTAPNVINKIPKKRGTFVVSMPERQPSRLMTATKLLGYSLAPLYDFWERFQVSHCGQYSVERMLALDEYCQRASIGRVLAVCLLFPLGPLLVILVTECMPLKPVENGPLANYVFWIRHTIMGIVLVMCAMVQAKAWVPEMSMTMKQVLVVAIGSASVYTAASILIADLWVFPVPFFVVTGAPLLIGIWAIASRLVLGPHPLKEVLDGEFQGRQFLLITSLHASLFVLYPAYQAGFLAVDRLLQFGMIALLPAINLALKNLQTALGSHLEDNLPEAVIFSVDVFSAIYSVLCMHSANSMKMVAITLVLNSLVLMLSLHGMNRRSRVARACRSFQLMERQQQKLRRRQSVLDSFITAGGSPALLSTLVNMTLRLLEAPGQLDSTELRAIRLLSGMPQKLTDSNSALLDMLAARRVYNNSRRTTEAAPVTQIKEQYSSAVMEGRRLSTIHFPAPTPLPRSKLARRLRAAVLVIPTSRWLSLRISTRTRSPLRNPESTNHSADSDASSETEKFTRQSSSLSSHASTAVSIAESPTPRRSQLLNSSSKSRLSDVIRLKSIRRSIPALWQETSDKLLPLVCKNNPVLGNILEVTRKQNTRAVKQTLQLLFNNEYLGLIAYTQCIIPVLYLLYMPVLQALPNHVYYPSHYRYFGEGNKFDERMMVIGVLALLQILLLLVLQVFVVRRFGVSTIYQVAFVLESRFMLLQGRVLMWFIFAVQSTLVHYGVDFTFRFEWLHKGIT